MIERFWDSLISPLRYRLRLRRRGYYDPYPDEEGCLRDDQDHSILGRLGVPDPSRPGYILTPYGISIPVGASLEVLRDRPLVASPDFPGRILGYLPLTGLTADSRRDRGPSFAEGYFTWLEEERLRQEQIVQDDLRRMDSPWAKAALNALGQSLTLIPIWFLSVLSPDSPDVATLVDQTRLIQYRDGYEKYKGAIAEEILSIYGPALYSLAQSPVRLLAAATTRELATAATGLRTTVVVSRAPRLLSRLAPRLNPANYAVELKGLGSNFGNLKLGYTGAEAAQTIEAAEHLRPAVTASEEASTLLDGSSHLRGHEFEEYLAQKLGGTGSFRAGGREFDGRVGNRWWEAKSGNVWEHLQKSPQKYRKFQSDIGAHAQIAKAHGATFELFSNTAIPKEIQEWLTTFDIKFTSPP